MQAPTLQLSGGSRFSRSHRQCLLRRTTGATRGTLIGAIMAVPTFSALELVAISARVVVTSALSLVATSASGPAPTNAMAMSATGDARRQAGLIKLIGCGKGSKSPLGPYYVVTGNEFLHTTRART